MGSSNFHQRARKGKFMAIVTLGIDLAKNVFVRPESRLSLCFTGGILRTAHQRARSSNGGTTSALYLFGELRAHYGPTCLTKKEALVVGGNVLTRFIRSEELGGVSTAMSSAYSTTGRTTRKRLSARNGRGR